VDLRLVLRVVPFALIAALAIARADVPRLGRAHAVRRTGPITIDGRLDEPAWQQAPEQGGFTQRFPVDGASPTFDTRFAVLYDDDAIYVGVWADDPQPALVRRLLTRRDIDAPADTVQVGIDSYHDRRTAFAFQLNAAGVERDMIVFDDQNVDDTWDAVWTGDAAITEHGWTAEFRIPLNQLRFSGDDLHEWGFQVVRTVARTQEQSSWSPWPRSGPQIVSRFGVIDGIDHLSPGRRLELLPYATAGLDVEPVDAADPLNSRYALKRGIGLDLKYGLGPAFTLSATINPDFGQVEADPSQVNLSANELFFSEKRPFFLEGVDLFKLPIGNNGDSSIEGAFYSRRIGAVPPDPDLDYDYIREPDAATIYGAAKLTGKTKSGWSLGLLDAVTGQESTEIEEGGVRSDPVVAPLTNFAVARVKRDFRDGKTAIGMSLTAVDRALSGTGLDTELADQAYTGGVQVQHRWADNAWQLDLKTVGSWLHGSEDAIATVQESNVHLFQRPDDSEAKFDPTRTALSGFGATWLVGRDGQTEHWRFAFGGDLRTPGLELNDLGYQNFSDRVIPYLWGQYRVDQPTKHLLNWQVSADVFSVSTFQPQLLSYGLEYSANAQLSNQWNLGLYGNLDQNLWDPVALRGGDELRTNPSAFFSAFVNTDVRKPLWVSVSMHGGRDWIADMTNVGIDLGATIQARPNLDLYVGPSYYARTDPMQYVDQEPDQAGTMHYVLARVDQVTASMTTRVNWTFSPHLSLQVYAQPFIGTGRYSDYKDVDDPHATRFADRFYLLHGNDYAIRDGIVFIDHGGEYSVTQPDFDLRQLRSTVVLRWEYHPGSFVYAIWSHGQTSTLDDGRFRPTKDLYGLATAPEENLVMVKVNYWIGL